MNPLFYPLRASALISALLIVAIVATMASLIMLHMQLNIARSQAVFDRDKALLLASRADVWAQRHLRQSLTEYLKTHQAEKANMVSPTFVIGNAKIQARLSDAEARLNINTFAGQAPLLRFSRFLKQVAKDITPRQQQTVSNALFQWLSHGPQAFDELYLQQQPPFSAAHMPFMTVANFRYVHGMTDKLFKQLKPYITALPVTSTLNINTASAPVLASLSHHITRDLADAIIDYRHQHQGFINLKQFTDYPGLNLGKQVIANLSLVSDYFYLTISINYHQQHWIIRHLLKRQYNNHGIIVQQIW